MSKGSPTVICLERPRSPWEELLFQKPDGFKHPFKLSTDSGAVKDRAKLLDAKKWDWAGMHDFFCEGRPENILHSKQADYLESIKKGEALFVVTGQQPGLLGGPVFWFYKALTAIALSKKLADEHNRTVVPVFWIAGDDSDLRECDHLELLDGMSPRDILSLNPDAKPSTVPMSERKLGSDTEQLVETLTSIWSLSAGVEEFLHPQWSYTRSFKRVLDYHLGPRGLLSVDGNSRYFKTLASESLRPIIYTWQDFEKQLNAATEEIEGLGYKPQVKYKDGLVHAFALQNGERNRILAKGGEFYTRTSGEILDIDKMLEDGGISQDAVSRPLLMEGAFPILCHVLGPHEIGYFLQLSRVFPLYAGGVPLLEPRMTATILSKRGLEAFGALGLGPEALPSLTGPRLKQRLASGSDEGSLAFWKGIEKEMELFLSKVDLSKNPQYGAAGEEAVRLEEPFRVAVRNNFTRFKLKAQKRLFKGDWGQYQFLFNELKWLGGGRGQDRHLNLFSLKARIGETGLEELIQTLDPLNREHQLVALELEDNE